MVCCDCLARAVIDTYGGTWSGACRCRLHLDVLRPAPVGLVVSTMGTIVLWRVVDPLLDAVEERVSDRVRRWLETPDLSAA